MDVLSEVLRQVKLQGALFFNAEFSAPWCIRSASAAAFTPYLCPGAERLIVYHFLTQGEAYIRLPDGERVQLTAGDIVILPQGDAHFLGNGSPEDPVDSLRALSDGLFQKLKLARHGGGGEITRFVCGYLACEPRLSDVFLAGLPRVLKVNIAREPSAQWLEHGLRYSVDQSGGEGAGTGLVHSTLSEVLFVETLRRYINTLPADQTGWLAGARDPMVGQALAILHGDPSQPFTVADLARR